MNFGRFRIGMRTIKSSLAVMLCILLFHFFNRGEAMIAALAAVFSLRQDLPTTLSFGKSRIMGNIIGGSTAIAYFVIQDQLNHSFIAELLLVPLAVAFVIVLSDGINNHAGINSGVATLLLIALSTSSGDQPLSFALQRVLDTFIGTLIAVGLNYLPTPKKDENSQNLL